MERVFEGFKKFILRGNVVDLAIGVLIGASFNSVVNSLVKGILTPLIGAIIKTPNFSGLFFTINSSKFMYGEFINSLVSFLLTALAVYFLIIIPMNALHSKKPVPPTSKVCPECKSEIPIDAKRCGHCTQIVN